MAYETLELAVIDNVATVTLNRPKVLNALNATMLRELDKLFAALALDGAVRVVLLRGAGGKAFAAGADIGELADADAASGEQLAGSTDRIFRRIETLGKPVIACIDGFALGGGCELAMACTLRLAASTARLGQPEIKLGLIPGYGGTQRLPRLVGRGAALKMILTGAIIDAAEALRIGLVDEVVPGDAEALATRAQALAKLLANMPPLAVAAAIEAVDRGAGLPLEQALTLEAALFGRLCATEDKREGTRAFLEKRPPNWLGR
ncbi:MAG: enoyl-CoA hydratase-related protein [Acidobacteriaceae bacterium]|jgi:enoyl-CoA hydratase